MAYTLQTPPVNEALDFVDTKNYLRVEVTEDDYLIKAFISAARRHTEQFLRRSLITQTWRRYLDTFPLYSTTLLPPGLVYGQNYPFNYPLTSSVNIDLEWGKVQLISSIKYYDENDFFQTFSSAKYRLDSVTEPARIVLVKGEVWPVTQYRRPNAVEIEYVAGYGATFANIPDDIQLAMKLLVGHWYENRMSVSDTEYLEMPLGVERILTPHRIMTFS